MPLDPATDLRTVFYRELELCGIRTGDTVGILTQGGKRSVYADAITAAVTDLGGSSFQVDIPRDGAPDDGGELGVRAGATGLGTLSPILVDAFGRCDLMVDLVFLLWSEQQARIRATGTRVLSCVEPPAVLKRLFPDALLERRVQAARALLEDASVMRISDDAGTDVAYELGQYGYLSQCGIANELGEWDHFASALVATVGADGGVDGTVVLKPGDILFPYERYLTEPVRLEVASGRITAIEGGFDAQLIRDYLASFDDERAYGLSHIGWGMNEHARWDALLIDDPDAQRSGTAGIGMDSRSYCGSVMFSTGPNVEFGGDNDTACHMDMPMRGCSVRLDDTLVIDRGRVVPEDVAPRGGRLRPAAR
jgi:2,5-dihydroxypyridine 5,6-dioxygenase